MYNHTEQDDHNLDDRLAEYTDRLMSMEKVEDSGLSEQDPELRSLQEMVGRLKRVLTEKQPSAATNLRLRANLIAAWRKNNPKIQRETAGRPGWLESILRYMRGTTQRNVSLRLAFVTAIILLVIAYFTPTIGSALTGTAGIEGSWVPVAIAMGVVVVVGLIVFLVSRFRR